MNDCRADHITLADLHMLSHDDTIPVSNVILQCRESGIPIDDVYESYVRVGLDTNELYHYASKYYDPTKAHEYYMRTRELKGRRRASDLNDEGKEIWNVAKANITDERDTKLEEQRTQRKIKMEGLRENARIRRLRIADKLREHLAQISKRQSEKLERERSSYESEIKKNKRKIDSERKDLEARLDAEKKRVERETAKISSDITALLNEDYSNLPNSVRLKKVEERKEKLSSLRGEIGTLNNDLLKKQEEILADSNKKIEKLQDSTDEQERLRKNTIAIRDKASKEKDSERKTASDSKETVRVELKNTLSATREAFKTAIDAIKSGAEITFQEEFESIKSQYGKASTTSGGVDYTPPQRSEEERRKIRRSLNSK